VKIYWDSSALIRALHEEDLRVRMEKGVHFTRAHTLSEVFSTITGGRLGFRYSPDEGFQLAASLAQDLRFVDLTPEETLAALAKAQDLGVRGARVHDLLHAAAAEKAGADKLWTLNLSDFAGLCPRAKVGLP
jgi:predicted nucleic acid-binding protein